MLKTLKYIYKSIQPVEKFPIGEYHKIILNNKRCYLFEPKYPNGKIILIVQGMTVRGIDDPRLLKQSEILRQLGYLVYLPHYPEIQNLEIKSESIDFICNDIGQISKENQNKSIGIISVSFSGGLSIIAASKEIVREVVDSLFIVGTFAHFRTIFEYLLLEQNIDPYGFYIILKNFIDIIPQYNLKELKEAFYIAAVDDGLKRNPPLLEEHFKKYPAIKEDFYNIKYNIEIRKHILKKLLESTQILELCEKFDVLSCIKNLKARISLIHGSNDIVIPAKESLILYEECKKYQIPAKIVITSLLDHGNIKFNLGLINEFYKLINTINYFLM